jgi:hypothetical protein
MLTVQVSAQLIIEHLKAAVQWLLPDAILIRVSPGKRAESILSATYMT